VTDTTSTDDDYTGDPPAAEAGSSDLVFGTGQGAWLSVVTLMAAAALALSIVALLTNNGDGGGGSAAPAGPATALSIEGTEFAFTPTDSNVVAGDAVDVTFDNAGAIEHELVFLQEGTTIASESEFDESMVLTRIGPIAGGASESGTVALTAGTYQIACLIPGHFDSGMNGTVVAS
jgi:uncharacterized cupredoxin-like copper-binding protein